MHVVLSDCYIFLLDQRWIIWKKSYQEYNKTNSLSAI